jgi:predicted glycosyltransferase
VGSALGCPNERNGLYTPEFICTFDQNNLVLTIKNAPKKILICPLDWGLGHASRSAAIIRELTREGHLVTLASDGAPLKLLKTEFPNLPVITLKGYGIQYQRYGPFFLKLIFSIPRIFFSIISEHRWLKATLLKHQFETVISDNRFGLWSNKTKCIFITHQLNIRLPWWLGAVNLVNRWFISRYDECWVPDFSGPKNLAGDLSHPAKPINNIKYLGILSRFKRPDKINWEQTNDLLVLLSGPEPQRSIFEKKILTQMSDIAFKAIILRGLPLCEKPMATSNKNLVIYNHLPSNEMEKIILSSKIVLCRSGYSSLMDLATLLKKAILVPTPGQTEQEYLAKSLKERGICYSETQNQFDLKRCLEECKSYSGFTEDFFSGA